MGRPKKEKSLDIDETQYVKLDVKDLLKPDYTESFKALLEALELQQIDKLLEDNNPEIFKQIGAYISKASKLGAPFVKNF